MKRGVIEVVKACYHIESKLRLTSTGRRLATAPCPECLGACVKPLGGVYWPVVAFRQRCGGEVITFCLPCNQAKDAGD